jgi:structural maintenance of chromosome 1
MIVDLVGVKGHVVDLCKPIQRKYETSMSVVLCRNIDAILVDEEKTAIDCIEVRFNRYSHGLVLTEFSTYATNGLDKRLSFRLTAFKSRRSTTSFVHLQRARLAVDVVQYAPAGAEWNRL